jgi:hypothetical protein
MAEGARFELADRLPHLQFSRLARSAAPSPLRAVRRYVALLSDAVKPSHIGAERRRNDDAPVRLLVVFKNSEQRSAHCEARSVQGMDELCLGVLLISLCAVSDVGSASLKRLKVAAGGDFTEVLLRGEPDFDVVGLGR